MPGFRYFLYGFLGIAAAMFAVDAWAGRIYLDPYFGNNAVYNMLQRERLNPTVRVPHNIPPTGIARMFHNSPYVEGSIPNRLGQTSRISLPGAVIDVEVKRPVQPSALAKAGRLALRASGYGALVMLGLDVLDWGWDADSEEFLIPASDGAPVSDRLWRVTQGASVTGCNQSSSSGCSWGTIITGLQAYTITTYSASSATYHGVVQVSGSGYRLRFNMTGAPWSFVDGYWVENYAPGSPYTVAATDADIETAIQQHLTTSGDSADFLRRLVQAGHVPDLDSIEISGPSSVVGETTTSTTQTPAGTATTSITTHYDITYEGDTITINRTDITNTTHPDGTEETTTTSTQGQTETPGEPDYSLTWANTDFPEVPELYEQKYPDGFAGVWDTRITEIQSTPLFTAVTGFTSGGPSSGTCPSWALSLNFGFVNLGTYNLGEDYCYVWPFVRLILLITALFVARRIVFGG